MTDRAQDIEVIRAALFFDASLQDMDAAELACDRLEARLEAAEQAYAARDEAAIVARGILNVKGSGDAAVAALGRLVARLEAAEQALAPLLAAADAVNEAQTP